MKNVLEALAQKQAEEATNLRCLLTLRYEILFRTYYCQAVGGDAEATKICVGIMERMAKINSVIPDQSLVTVDQRSVHVDDGGIGIMELANMVYEGEKRAVGSSGRGC